MALQQAPDKFGTAFGGKLGFETNSEHLYGFSLGAVYYGANDLGTNKEISARAPFTPTVDVDILGEAFVRWTGFETTLTAGNILIDTPFANPSDAFVVPITYTGYSLINKSLSGLTLQVHHLTHIKTREAQKFAEIGNFIFSRRSAPPGPAPSIPPDTVGTSIVGGIYDWQKLKLQFWYYHFDELFNLQFGQLDYDWSGGSRFAPYISLQGGNENSMGKEWYGNFNSSLSGAKLGVKAFGADLSVAMNNVSGSGFVMPFTYFTDITYTNSMISGIGNVASGTGWKSVLQYNFTSQLWGRAYYSSFKFAGDKDLSETGFDLRHKFKGDLDKLSLWFRVGYRSGNDNPAGYPDLLEYRTQIQYIF